MFSTAQPTPTPQSGGVEKSERVSGWHYIAGVGEGRLAQMG
ncbi:hypothetical protein EMIT048CA2_250006 [Pseudomonas chlororaphis]